MVFGIEESSKFARALANSEGIRVTQKGENITPYSMRDGSIIVGTPSIYHHDEYMGNLHREISKQTKDMSFFHSVETEENSLQHLAKNILQAHRTEYHMEGEYQGRDRILREQYSKNMKDAGGIQKVIEDVSRDNKTAAAMLYIGNELRNDWQGYHHVEMPKGIASEVKRLSPMLEDEWLSLNSKESLETLLQRIQYEEQQEEEQQDDGDSEGDGSEGGKGSGDGQGAAQEEDGDVPEGEEGESPGDGEQDAEGEPGEAEGDHSGDPEESSEGSGGDGEPDDSTSDDDQGDDGDDGDSGEDEQDSEGGDSGSSGGQPDSSEVSEQGSDPSGATEGQGSETDGDTEVSIAHNHHGATEASVSLKDIGLIKEPVEVLEYVNENNVPYVPRDDVRYTDVTQDTHSETSYTKAITRSLASFKLSKRIRKYLISMSQTGYQYGMKRGKICPKNISRVYAGHQQPRIFKQKLATKIQKDTAIFILGDCSGSMSNERYTTSASCQVAISETLQSLQIAHMMMQFSTGGVGRAHYIMKRFEERYVSRDKLINRYGSSQIYMGCNADGEAVTDAAQKLAKRDEKNKILIVLSDGAPAYGYGNDHQFLVDTVKEIEESKVMDIIGIGIQTTSVERFYKDSKVVNRLEELEGVLLNLLKEKVLK